MTVNTSTSVASGIGNGVTTVFPFNFKLVDEADLVVLDVTTADESFVQLVLNTDYTVQGVGDESGGSITLTTPLPIGHKVKMARELDILQQTDLRNQGKFFAETHEEAFDRFIMIAQQLQNAVDRSVKVPITSDTPADELYQEFKDDIAQADQAATTAIDAKDEAQSIANKFGDVDAAVTLTEALRDQAAASEAAASTSAVTSANEAGAASADADRAEAAAASAAVAADVYSDTAAGLAATVEGDQFQVLSADGTEYIRYSHDAGPVATEVARFPSPTYLSGVAETVDTSERYRTLRERKAIQLAESGARQQKAAVVILLGQSLNAPRGSTVLAKSAPAFMPIGGTSITTWQYNGLNALHACHWSELASASEYSEPSGQTPGVGIASTLAGSKYSRIYIGNAAIGARTLEILGSTGPITNLWALMMRLCRLARDDGYLPEVMFYSQHGEANAAAGTTEQAYYDLGQWYYGMCQHYAAQAMRKPGYVAPVVLGYPVQQQQDEADRNIKEAIRRLAKDLPGAIDLGPIYQWPCSTDRIHPLESSYVQRGEAVGRLLRSYSEGFTPRPLSIVDVTLSGAEFVATFSAPVVRDDSLGVGQSLNTAIAEDGFEWLDNGSAIAITALSYEGWKVRGTLGAAPVGAIGQQVLRVAEQLTTITATAGADNLPGSVVRADSDGWQSIYDYTYTNREWATPQRYSNVRAI